MDIKKIAKIMLMVLPFCLFLVGATYLPVHTSIKILMIPFIPILLLFDATFYLAPLCIIILFAWLLMFVVKLFKGKAFEFIKKTKYIFLAAIIVTVLGLCASTHTTTFLLDADIPGLGLTAED